MLVCVLPLSHMHFYASKRQILHCFTVFVVMKHIIYMLTITETVAIMLSYIFPMSNAKVHGMYLTKIELISFLWTPFIFISEYIIVVFSVLV